MSKVRWLRTTVLLSISLICIRNPLASEVIHESDIIENVQTAASIVKLIGSRFDGTGIIVMVDGKPGILSASHIFQATQKDRATGVEVELPTQTLPFEQGPLGPDNVRRSFVHRTPDPKSPGKEKSQELVAFIPPGSKSRIVYDSPGADVTVLSLPEGIDSATRLFFEKAAELNGSFCTGRKPGCKPGFTPGPGTKKSSQLYPQVDSVPEPGARTSMLLASYPPVLSDDLYVSGRMDHICKIPGYERKGFSGGALYVHGRLVCMISQVSTGGDPSTIGLWMPEIAKVLSKKPDGEWIDPASPPPELRSCPLLRESASRSANSTRLLMRRDGKDVLVGGPDLDGFASAGGEHTGGGGEHTGGGGEHTGGGGDGSHEDWKLNIMDSTTITGPGYFFHRNTSDPVTLRLRKDVETLNPFTQKSQAILLNCRKMAYLEIRNVGPQNKTIFWSPSMAAYLWLKRNRPHDFVVHYADEDSEALLAHERRVRARQMRFGRLFSSNGPDSYHLINTNCDALKGDVSQALLSRFDQDPHSKDPVLSPSCLELKTRREPDYYGFFKGEPFSTREAEGWILDTRYRVPGHPDDINEIQIPADMSQIRVIQNHREPGLFGIYHKKTTILKPLPDKSSGSRVFVSDSGGCAARAVVEYTSENLKELERIFVDVKDWGGSHGSMAEFLNCVPGKDCMP